MTNKRALAIAAGVVIVLGGAVTIGHQLWGTPAPPPPAPKAQALLSCQPAPVTFTDNTVFTAAPGVRFHDSRWWCQPQEPVERDHLGRKLGRRQQEALSLCQVRPRQQPRTASVQRDRRLPPHSG